MAKTETTKGIEETLDSTPATPATPEPTALDMAAFARMFGVSVADALEARDAKNKKVTPGEYARREASGRSKLTRPFFQNGVLIFDRQLSNEEIDLINKITHTGRYINRMVDIIVRDEGPDTVVEMRYKNATRDQMFELRNHVRSMTDMLQQIVAAQADERQVHKDAEERTIQRRPFGSNGQFIKAKAAAEAGVS